MIKVLQTKNECAKGCFDIALELRLKCKAQPTGRAFCVLGLCFCSLFGVGKRNLNSAGYGSRYALVSADLFLAVANKLAESGL